MATAELGRLTRLSLRKGWSSEPLDFTRWLALPENLSLLGETLGLELEVEAVEAGVGPYQADIHCKDTKDGSWVVIENQLERTDHKHLGQLLTYAAGLDARTMIWISDHFTDQHRAALDWLNEHTTEAISFIGLEIELWQIGDSAPAPKFNIVSKPNDWSKVVKATSGADGKLTEQKKLQLEFWTAFKAWSQENSRIHLPSPSVNNWLPIGSGRSGFYYAVCTSLWNSFTKVKESELRVELVVSTSIAKEHFKTLAAQQAQLEQRVGAKLHWIDLPEVKQCRVFVHHNSDIADRKAWNEQFKWLSDNVLRFQQAFGPLIKAL